jgi:tetratricopeptide (TPR) repeat protein
LQNLCEKLSVTLSLHLDQVWNEGGGVARSWDIPPSLEGYTEWRAAADAWYVRGDVEESLVHIEQVLRLDPSWVPAKFYTAVAHMNLPGHLAIADSILKEVEESGYALSPGNVAMRKWMRATLEGDREGAYLAMKGGDFHDNSSILLWVSEALQMNLPEEALEVLSGLDPDDPTMQHMTGYWTSLAAARHALHDHERELREVIRGRTRHPDNRGLFYAEIRARTALGQVREVEDLVEEAVRKDAQPVQAARSAGLEFRAHGDSAAASAFYERALDMLRGRPEEVPGTTSYRRDLAETLYLLGRWAEARAIVDGLLQEEPGNVEYMGLLGSLAARTGDPEEARRMSVRLESMEIPYDWGNSTFLRARIAALLGERERAVELLRAAHEQGWGFFRNLHTEMDFEGLQGFGPFEEFKRPNG